MQLIALLAWYDEEPKHLATCVASLAKAGVGHLVAVDGAYALYPDGEPLSDGRQQLAIQYMCAEIGIGLTLHTPRAVWEGNEVEKRQCLFDLALTVADEGDWFLVIDADEVIAEAPLDLFETLGTTPHQVAQITHRELAAVVANDPTWEPDTPLLRLYRAQPIKVDGNHYTHRNPAGEVICGHVDQMQVEWADATELRIDHRRGLRAPERQHTQGTYYDNMNRSAQERLRCKCGAPGKHQLPTEWRLTDVGPAADLEDFCDRCAKRIRRQNERRLREIGIAPESLKITHRYGRAPEEIAA